MAHTPPLVSTHWLAEHREAPDVVILDASVYLSPAREGQVRGEFRSGLDSFVQDGHLPGAQFADLFGLFSDLQAALPFVRPSGAQFALAAGALGISPQAHVVVYDGLVGQWASRLWWLFRSFGHERVSVLDGGLRKHVADGYPLELGPQAPRPASPYPAARGAQRYASLDDVLEVVQGRRQGQLVCLLLPADFEGTVSVRSRAGHIPGSVNLPFRRLIDERSNTLLPPAGLRAAFEEVVDLDGPPIITYCGGGIASTLGSLALAVIGCDRTAEFDGSLSEWVLDPARPLETGR